MDRQEALRTGSTRYTGKVCVKHPELEGCRRTANGRCYECAKIMSRNLLRIKQRTRGHPAWVNQQERTRKSRQKNMGRALASNQKRRAYKFNRVLGDQKVVVEFYRSCPKGFTVDHIVPLSPCRDCGDQGWHTIGNLQYLSSSTNFSKGDRCQDCYNRAVSDALTNPISTRQSRLLENKLVGSPDDTALTSTTTAGSVSCEYID